MRYTKQKSSPLYNLAQKHHLRNKSLLMDLAQFHIENRYLCIYFVYLKNINIHSQKDSITKPIKDVKVKRSRSCLTLKRKV